MKSLNFGVLKPLNHHRIRSIFDFIVCIFPPIICHRKMPKNSKSEMDSQDTLIFSSVIKHKEIGKKFYEFLTENKNTNGWDFILSSHLLNSLIEKSEYNGAVEHMKYIMKTFFTLETKPLNLVSQNSQDIALKMKTIWKNQSLIELKLLTDMLQDILVKDYQNILFPEFLKTPVAQKLIKKYKKEKKIVVPKLSQIVEYENRNFESTEFDSKDLEFCTQFIMENRQHWETIYVSSKIKCFKSNQNYFPNVTFIENLDNFILEFIFDYPFEESVCALLYRYFENDINVVYTKALEYKPNESVLIEQHIRLPSRCSRYKQYLVSLHYDSGKLMSINKPVKMGNVEFLAKSKMEIFNPKTKTFDMEIAIQDFIFQSATVAKHSSNSSKMTLQLNVDLGFGSWGVPKTLIKWKAQEIYRTYTRHVEGLKSKKFQDLKGEFSEMKDGLPLNPLGKLLCDLNVFHEEVPKPQNPTELFVMNNILETIKKDPSEENIQKNFESNVLSMITSTISNDLNSTKSQDQLTGFQFKRKNSLDFEFIKFDEDKETKEASLNFLDFSEILVKDEFHTKLDNFESLGNSVDYLKEIDELLTSFHNEEEEFFDNETKKINF
jgi:hypothetical protein